MIVKNIFIFAILVIIIELIDTKSVSTEAQKRVRCYNPSKPEDMPQDVYDKYKISSRHLAEEDQKDLWAKFKDWWKGVFAQIGNFFRKVGTFFENLFTKKKNNNNDITTTIEPPTPAPEKLRSGANKLICIEYEENTEYANGMQTTKIYELDLTTMTTIDTTYGPTATAGESSYTTPFDPNGNRRDKDPVIIGVEQKAKSEIAKEHNTEATVVRSV